MNRAKRFLTLFLIVQLFPLGVLAAVNVLPGQPNWLSVGPVITFPKGQIQGSNTNELAQNAIVYLKANITDLQTQGSGLALTQNTASPYARYITFAQTFNGVPIYRTTVKIAIDKKNNIVSVISKTGNVSAWASNVAVPDVDLGAARAAIGQCDSFTLAKTWFYQAEGAEPAYLVTCSKNDGTRDDEIVLNSGYQVIYSNSLMMHYKYPDSLVTMYVFYPDPLTSAHSPYVNPYTNHDDSDVAALDSQMMPKQIRTSVLNNDSFILENEFVIEKDLSPPSYPEHTWSRVPLFRYHRDSSAFRDLMIYYYINTWRNHLSALGYDSLGHIQITVDPSGGTDDNSTCYPSSAVIYFGIGGIPDAEDADVPTHEYTHFLSYSACNNCASNGTERAALDEGTADYFAASTSKAIDTYNWEKVYNWDGNNAADDWFGRSCDVQDVYPGALDTFNDEPHLCGQLWSSSLMQIWDSIGRTKTDRIMLETLYSMVGGISMADAAKLYLKNDSLMYKDTGADVIDYYFVQRGFLPNLNKGSGIDPQNPTVWYKVNTSYFPSGNKVIFDFGQPQTGTFSLYDMTGKQIGIETVSGSNHVEFTAQPIAEGIYIMGVNTNGLQKSFKLFK